METLYGRKIKERKTEKITFSTTRTEKFEILDAAKKFNMSVSAYAESKVLNPQKLTRYIKGVMHTTLVEVGAVIDEIYDLCEKTDSDFISKTDLLPLLERGRKGVDQLWH